MDKQVEKLDSVMNLMGASGVNVRLRDKNDLRERYSIRRNGSNAFERTDVALAYGFVVVTDYDSMNRQIGSSVISVVQKNKDAAGELENKMALLKTKLQGMTSILRR